VQRAETMDHSRVLRYLLKRMEPLRCVPFVLIYGCATLGDERYPDTNFMQSIFDLYACRYCFNEAVRRLTVVVSCPDLLHTAPSTVQLSLRGISYRYNDTLLKFYIMHASFSFRMYFWLLLPLETTT
jgi:hypothetical protein